MTSASAPAPRPIVIVLAGVAGSGKSTIGSKLASSLGWSFLDADSLHAPTSIEKMRAGVPLSDEDRAPWLMEISRRIADTLIRREGMVLACSALTRAYRRRLDPTCDRRIFWVFLQGRPDLLVSRLHDRVDHFMNPALLASQIETFEPPEAEENAMIVQIEATPDDIVRQISGTLGQTH